MAANDFFLLKTPWEMMGLIAQRVKAERLRQNLPQREVAQRAGISVGTLKTFEKTGEIHIRNLLQIALVLGRLADFESLFANPERPQSLFAPPPQKKTRQRARTTGSRAAANGEEPSAPTHRR